MKKYITVAALLAAGTAFANALSLADFTVHGGNVGYSTTDGTFSVALTLDVKELRLLLEKGQSAAWGTEILTYDCNGTITGVVVNGGSSGGKVNTSSLWAKWGDENAWGNFGENGEVDTDLADLNGTEEGTGWDSVAYAGLAYTFSSTAGTKASLALLDSSQNLIVQIDETMGGLKSGSATAAPLTFGNTVLTSYFYDSVATEAEYKSIVKEAALATPIPAPEPSAFGMLAGLGALALVASRRRRK